MTTPVHEYDKAVAWCEQRTGKTLAPSQREALKNGSYGSRSAFS